MFKIVIFLTLSVLCVVNTQSDDGCRHSRSYTRVKRGKYYPGPPMRFYNRPPISFPIKGPYSHTPPPFMQDDEPQYPGGRPSYKVSKRPTNEGLGDADINNLVKYLSKQDLDKILDFAYEKDKYSDKSKDIDDYSRPHKRENSQRPTYTKDFYKGNIDTKHQEEKPYEVEFKKYVNYVTEATPIKYTQQDDRRNTYSIDTEPNQVQFYGPQESRPSQIRGYAPQDERPTQFKVYAPQVDRPTELKFYGPQDEQPSAFKPYAPQTDQRPPAPETDDSLSSQTFGNPEAPNSYPGSSNSFFSDTAEEEKLPPPVNMREEDFDVSYTNNVPTVVKADSSSYQVENFGDLPLMNYNSKLHSVSSYHVPHYTVTQSKSQSPQSPPAPSTSYSSSQSYSSSSALLKPSPAAASIKTPPYEAAPPLSAAKDQSDAHLKAIKIRSHRSKGAAYTLHDDGTLTPEWPRPPKYG